MIRLRKIPIVFAIFFCLFQGEALIVYGEGVSINFNNLSISGATVSSQTWGNQTTATSPVTPISSTPISSVSETQNVNQNSIISSTSTSTNLSISGQIQQSNISGNLFKTFEQSSEFRTPNFNSLSGKELLLPTAEPYSVTVCLSYNDKTASGCVDIKSPSQASEKLASMILKKYLKDLKGGDIRPFRVVMPSSMSTDQQIQTLLQIETETIALIEGVFLKKGNQQNQNVFIEYLKIARQEADSGVNWSHSSKDDSSIHTFNIRKAFSQLNNISISGR